MLLRKSDQSNEVNDSPLIGNETLTSPTLSRRLRHCFNSLRDPINQNTQTDCYDVTDEHGKFG